MNQTENDYLIYDADDEAISEWFKTNKTKAQLIPFSLTKTFENGAFIKNDTMDIIINNEEFEMKNRRSFSGRKAQHEKRHGCNVCSPTDENQKGNYS